MSIVVAKPTWEMIAPILPPAAEIPWTVERYPVVNTSPRMMKSITLGLKFWKRFERQ
jgi:hypothetical protein